MHPLDFFSYCPHCGSKQFEIAAPNSKKCYQCGFEYYKNPAIGAAAFISDLQGRLLTTKRKKNPCAGALDLPGGFVDLNETVEQALIRELKEELNIDIGVDNYLFSIPNTYTYKGYDSQPLDFFFRAHIIDSSQMKTEESEISAVQFIKPEEINPADFGLPSIRTAVSRFLEHCI